MNIYHACGNQKCVGVQKFDRETSWNKTTLRNSLIEVAFVVVGMDSRGRRQHSFVV